MKTKALLDQARPPESVEEVLELARCGTGVRVAVRPRITLDKTAPDRNHPAFQLRGSFAVQTGDRTASFDKTYAKGHEVLPAKSAANGFLIANTRLFRDVKKLRQAGIKCESEPFVLSHMLPDTDLAEFEPRKPYTLGQFAILASIGCPLKVAMTTFTRNITRDDGRPGHELCALYTIEYQAGSYQIETRHGEFPRGADPAEIALVLERARHQLPAEEQYNLRRVGVEIQMGPLWPGEKDTRFSVVPAGFAGGNDAQKGEEARPALRAV